MYIYIQCCALFRHRALRLLVGLFFLICGSLSGPFGIKFGGFWGPCRKMAPPGELKGHKSKTEPDTHAKPQDSGHPFSHFFHKFHEKGAPPKRLKNKVAFKRLFKALGT